MHKNNEIKKLMLRKTLVLTLITVIVIILLPILEVAVADVTLEGDTYHCEYKWEYKNSKWTYTARIAKWDYDDYHSIPVEQRKNYGFMVTTLDPEVKEIGNKLHELATKEGYSSYDEASFVLAFVQSLRYTPDILTGYDEYPRFPVETLVDDGGDCEDTAILYATLIRIIGYGCVLLAFPDHMMVGVKGTNLPGWYVEYNGARYYCCETTGKNWKIGDIPPEYENAKVRVIPITGEQYVPSKKGEYSSDTPISPLMPPSFYPSDILDIFTPFVILLFVVIIGSLASVAVIATKKRKVGPPLSALELRLTPPQIEAPPLPPSTTVAPAIPERITCPKCQYQNIIGLRYCVNCDEILSREVLQQRFCIFCGGKVESSFKFCINCGKELFKKALRGNLDSSS